MRFSFLILSGLCGWASVANTAPFTYDDLVKTIQDHHVTSIEALLPLLPEAFRKNYVLMHDSQSLQGATFENPRIALFGEDASLTCAFNGAAPEAGFDALECFQYKSAERAFDFRQIVFPTAENKRTEVGFSSRGVSVDGRVQCASCHGADPRPNWNDYPAWPDTYGEGDTSGNSHYQAFKDAMAAHPRYQWLPKEPGGSQPVSDLDNRTNLKFSDFVGRMNAWRDARILESKVSRSKALGFAVTALGCELTAADVDALKNVSYSADLDMKATLTQLGVTPFEWTTRPLSHLTPHISSYDYEHQSGFTYLLSSVGMTQVKELADAGNRELREGLAKLHEAIPSQRHGQADYFLALWEVLPDLDKFSYHDDNKNFVCPGISHAFAASYQP